MKIEVYAVCYNEEYILPSFIKHYKKKFNADIIFYDQMSTDNSRQIMQDYKCKIIDNKNIGFNDLANANFKNSAWKGTKASWVICCDTDEFLEVDFKIHNSCTILSVDGYNMVGDLKSRYGIKYNNSKIKQEHPWDLFSGKISTGMNKKIMFKPSRIHSTNYSVGSHIMNPKGFVNYSVEKAKLLHRKYISVDYVMERHGKNGKNMSSLNLKNNWSHHCSSVDNSRELWESVFEYLHANKTYIPYPLTLL